VDGCDQSNGNRHNSSLADERNRQQKRRLRTYRTDAGRLQGWYRDQTANHVVSLHGFHEEAHDVGNWHSRPTVLRSRSHFVRIEKPYGNDARVDRCSRIVDQRPGVAGRNPFLATVRCDAVVIDFLCRVVPRRPWIGQKQIFYSLTCWSDLLAWFG